MAKKPKANETAPADVTPAPADVTAAQALSRCTNCGYALEDHVLHDSGHQRCPVFWRTVTFFQ